MKAEGMTNKSATANVVATARVVQPHGWPKPKGYANGIIAKGSIFAIGGCVGWDESGRFAEGFIAQSKQALTNIRTILKAGNASPDHLIRLTWYVTSIENYIEDLPALGKAYRDVLGNHFPAMAVVQVSRFVEQAALVEIEATAVIPEQV